MEYPPFTIPILLSLRSSLAHHLYPQVLDALVLVELGLEVVPYGDLGGAFAVTSAMPFCMVLPL